MENMEKWELTLFKPNQLIEIECNYVSPVNRLAYNYIIHKLQKSSTQLIRLNIADFFKDLNLGKNYDELISYLDSLQKIRVVSRDTKGKLWGAFNLLSYFNKNDDGTFDVEVPGIIFDALCNDNKEKKQLYYTTIKLLEEKSFKSSYTIVFYELFKKYERDKVNIPIYDLEDLKKITGSSNKYKEYRDFRRYVLKKSLDEINNFDLKYHYSYTEIKAGRKVDKIQFTKEEKLTENIIDITPIKEVKEYSDKFLAAIEKVKKNQYVAKKYSQRAVKKAVQQFGEEMVIKAFKEIYKYNKTITSFSKFLNSAISEIKENESLKKEIKKKNTSVKTENNIKKEEKINETFDLSTFEGMKSFVYKELMFLKNIDPNKKITIFAELSPIQNIDDLKALIKKYNLEINLKLF